MDFGEVYHFLFETYAGIGCLIGAGLVLSLLAAVLMEWRARKKLKLHNETAGNKGWDLFDDDPAEEEDE